MPLSNSKNAQQKNIAELQSSKPGVARKKAIHTYMKSHGVDYSTAKTKIAVAIAMNMKRG
jgi:hypothetical protein